MIIILGKDREHIRLAEIEAQIAQLDDIIRNANRIPESFIWRRDDLIRRSIRIRKSLEFAKSDPGYTIDIAHAAVFLIILVIFMWMAFGQ